MRMFRPLRSLSQLQNLYVVFMTDGCEMRFPWQCSQNLHDDEVHRQGPYRTFWWRKEFGRAWRRRLRLRYWMTRICQDRSVWIHVSKPIDITIVMITVVRRPIAIEFYFERILIKSCKATPLHRNEHFTLSV